MITDVLKAAAPSSTVYDRGEKGSVTGLHLRVTPAGKKGFYLFYRTKSGTQRRPKLGEYPTLTLSDARELARDLLLRVANGEDPSLETQEARAEITVGELYALCMELHWSAERFKASGWAREAARNYENHILPTFGQKRLSEVTAVEVKAWHRKMAATPYAGNRSLEILSKMFSFAAESGMRPPGTNPCSFVEAHTERKRSRYASVEEIKRLGDILLREGEEHPEAAAFLWLLIFTGSRPRAIERARWDQLTTFLHDGETFGILTFDGKSTEDTGEKETVVIPPPAMKILSKLPRDRQTIVGCKFPRHLWSKIRNEANAPDLWARDWRRTFATIGMSNGVSKDVIGGLLNHHDPKTTDVYAKLMVGSRVKAAQEIAGLIGGLISPRE